MATENEDSMAMKLVRGWFKQPAMAYAKERPFNFGARRADLVTLDAGTITAFEIKSDRDSFARLPEQSAAYQKAFEKSYLVTTPNMLRKLDMSSLGAMGLKVAHPGGYIQLITSATASPTFCIRTHLDLLNKSQLPTVGVPSGVRQSKQTLIEYFAETRSDKDVREMVYTTWYKAIKPITNMFESELLTPCAITPDELMILNFRDTTIRL